MLFQDDTISITPITPYGTDTTGYASSPIKIDGLQNLIKIVDQLLTGLVSTPGTILDTDKIVEAMGKIKATLPTAYSAATTSTSLIMNPFQRVMRVTELGQTIQLPPYNDPGVILEPYLIIFPPDASSAGTVGVTVGDFLNGTINSTYAAPISTSVPSPVWAISDGTGWWIC